MFLILVMVAAFYVGLGANDPCGYNKEKPVETPSLVIEGIHE